MDEINFLSDIINADNIITFCLYLTNKICRNLIKIRSCAILSDLTRLTGSLVTLKSINVFGFDWLIRKYGTFSLLDSWCLRNKLKLACDLQSLSHNVIMQVLFPAAVIVLVLVQYKILARKSYILV